MSEKPAGTKRYGLMVAGLFSLGLGVGAGAVAATSGYLPVADLLGRGGEHSAFAPGRGAAYPSFVALEPVTITLGPEAASRHLRLVLQLEVAPGAEESVGRSVPRILDVLNGFLRAVDERDLEQPRAMARLRAQMLRRVQLVTLPGAVHDVLIQEFVLN